MIEEYESLIDDFNKALAQAGHNLPATPICHECLSAPHEPRSLPKGKGAVYVFSLCADYGQTCPAGPNRVLKVGRAGPNSNSRFQYQHYNHQAAPSNLAYCLHNLRILWPYLGIDQLQEKDVRDWIMRYTDRDHFYLDGMEKELLILLEIYIRARLGSVFEGNLRRLH